MIWNMPNASLNKAHKHIRYNNIYIRRYKSHKFDRDCVKPQGFIYGKTLSCSDSNNSNAMED